MDKYDYDGKSSLNTALATLHGRTKNYSNDEFSDLTRKYKAGLGLNDSDKLVKPEHKLFIFGEECKLTTPYAHEAPPTPPKLDSMSVAERKIKRPDKIAAKGDRTATKAYAIYIDGTQVKVYLEPTFVEALDVLFGQDNKRQKGFLKTVALNDASANPSSNARCAIVRELLKRV